MRTNRLLGGLVLSSALLVGSSALAQAAAGPAAASGGATAGDAMSGSAASAPTGYNLDTPIETLVADPAAKAVLDRDLPGLTTHPMYEQFKAMSLTDVAPVSGGKMTDAAMARTKADLAKLPPK